MPAWQTLDEFDFDARLAATRGLIDAGLLSLEGSCVAAVRASRGAGTCAFVRAR